MKGGKGHEGAAVSALQRAAWAACNASYFQPDGSLYRVLGRSLYQQDLHEQIESLFARSDRQNENLGRLLAATA